MQVTIDIAKAETRAQDHFHPHKAQYFEKYQEYNHQKGVLLDAEVTRDKNGDEEWFFSVKMSTSIQSFINSAVVLSLPQTAADKFDGKIITWTGDDASIIPQVDGPGIVGLNDNISVASAASDTSYASVFVQSSTDEENVDSDNGTDGDEGSDYDGDLNSDSDDSDNGDSNSDGVDSDAILEPPRVHDHFYNEHGLNHNVSEV